MKKVFNVLIILVIVISFLFLTGNYIINKNLYSTISSAFTGKRVSSYVITAIYNKIPNMTIEKLGSIQSSIESSPYMNDISKKYVNAMVKDIQTGQASRVNIDNELDKMLSQLDGEFSKLELFKIKQEINNSDFNSIYEYSFDSVVNNDLVKPILKIYNITNKYKYIFSILLVISFISMFLINKTEKFKVFAYTFCALAASSLIFVLFERFILEKKLMLLMNESSYIININIFYIFMTTFLAVAILLFILSNKTRK